jgi:transmembrane sensor
MMNYSQYNAEELAADPSFVAWVRGSDARACEFWDNWILRHTERISVVNEARDIVQRLQFKDYAFRTEMEEVKDNLQRAQEFSRKAARRSRLLWLYREAAVAAAMILVAGSWWFFHRPAPKAKTSEAVAKTFARITPSAPHAPSWRTKTNTGRKAAKILLEDSSVVTLFNNATIQYPEPFTGDKREIRLTGDAVFEVAKDPRRRFIVYSRMLAVTVLGTSFRIISPEKKKESVTIKLFTGKVQIRPTENLDNWKSDESIFLLPGQQLEYNRSHRVVSRFRPAGVPPTGTNFNNTPLPVVMKALSDLYKTKIDYNLSDIAEINFTGTIDKGDELKAVLHAIAQMNGLKIIPTQDGFLVTRSGK